MGEARCAINELFAVKKNTEAFKLKKIPLSPQASLAISLFFTEVPNILKSGLQYHPLLVKKSPS